MVSDDMAARELSALAAPGVSGRVHGVASRRPGCVSAADSLNERRGLEGALFERVRFLALVTVPHRGGASLKLGAVRNAAGKKANGIDGPAMELAGTVGRVATVGVALGYHAVFIVNYVLGLATLGFRTSGFDCLGLCLKGAGKWRSVFHGVSPASLGVNGMNESIRHLVLLLVGTVGPSYPAPEPVNPRPI